MELTLDQRNALTDALIATFPDSKKLNLMLGRDLGIGLSSIIQNPNDIEETAWEVVNWFERKGKTHTSNLIIASSRRYPGNPKLQEFVISNIHHLLEDTFEPIDCEYLMKLVKILNRVDSLEPLVAALFSVKSVKAREQDVKAHKENNLDFLAKNSNPHAINIYFLLDILKSYPSANPCHPNLFEFSRYLATNLSTSSLSSVANELNSWAEEVLERFDLKPPEFETPDKVEDSIEETQSQVTDISLMIVISEHRSESQSDKFNCEIRACLQQYNTQNRESKLLDIVDVFDAAYSTTGKLCEFDKIEKNIENLIDRSVIYISDSLVDEPPLVIEVFLPIKWMLEKVDLWKSGSFQTEIGYQYQVVLRSYERLSGQPRYLFSRAWNNFCSSVYESKDATPELLKKYVSHLQSESDFSKGSRLKEKVAVKMTCPPSTKGSHRFFKLLISANVPLAMWVRCHSLKSVKAESWPTVLDDFFDWDLLRQRLRLLEKVLQCRGEDEFLDDSLRGLGSHLSVLSDDPNRVPAAIALDSHEE